MRLTNHQLCERLAYEIRNQCRREVMLPILREIEARMCPQPPPKIAPPSFRKEVKR